MTLLATALLGAYGAAGAAGTSYSAGPGQTVNVTDSSITNTGTVSAIKADGTDAKITFDNTSIEINWNGSNASNTANAALQAENGGNITINGGTVNTGWGSDSNKNDVRKQGLQAIDGGTITASNVTINTTGGKSPGVQAFRTYTDSTAGDTPTVINLDNVTINTGGPEYSVGIRADHKGASVIGVNTNIDTTGGTSSNSYGVEVDDGGTVQLTGGTITTSGDLAAGVRAYTGDGALGTFGPGVATLAGTTIDTTGNHASGLIAGDSDEPTAGIINATNVSITTTGTNATGLQANYGEIRSSGSTIMTSGSHAHAAEALNGASITLSGDTLTASGSGAYGLHVSGTGSSITANDATIKTMHGKYGVLAENGGQATLSGGSVTNAGTLSDRMTIYATGAGTSVTTQGVALTNTAAGGGTGDLSNVVSAASHATITLNGGSVSSQGSTFGRGILAGTNASVAANGVDISTIGTLSNAVHAYSKQQLLTDPADTAFITLDSGTAGTSGDNSYGLFSQNKGSSVSATGNTVITTTGANSFGAVAYNGGALDLGGVTLTTSGSGADGIAVNELLGAQAPVHVPTPNYASTLTLSNSSISSQQANGIFLGQGSTATISNTNIVAAQFGMVVQDGASAAVTGGSVTSTGSTSGAVYLQDNATAGFTGTTLNSTGATFTSALTQAGQAQSITLGSGTNVAGNNGTLLGVTRSGGGADGTIALALQDGSFAQGNVYDPSGANQVTVTKGANAHWAGLVVDSTTHTVDADSTPTQTDFSSTGNVVIAGGASTVSFVGTTVMGGDFSGATAGSTVFSGSTTISGNLVGAQGSTTNFTGSANIGSVTGGSGSNINFTGSSTNIQGDVSGNQGTQITFSKGGSTTIGGSVSLSGSGTSTHGGTVENPIIVQGDVTVGDGATLGGNITSSGSLGGSGGTVGPGNSVGVQSYASSAGFTGNYFAEVNAAGKSDLLIIRTGNFDLSGIGLTVGQENGNGGYVLNHTYTIVQTPGGQVQNAFKSTALDSSFAGTLVKLDPVKYNAQDVEISLSVDNAAVGASRTGLSKNQSATLDGVLSVAGKNTAADAALQSTDTGGVLNQLSGEVHASTQAALLNTGDLLVRTLTDRMRGNLGAPRVAGAPVAAAGELPSGALPHSSALPLWAQVVGDWQSFKGGSDGAASSKLSLAGLYLGGDTQVGASGWRVGAALGYTNGRLNVDDRDSRSDLDSYTASIYGGKSWQTGKGRVNFLAGAAYTRNNVDSRRNVNVGGNQALKASYHADSAQLFTELGYAMPVGRSASIEPYARLAWINQRTQSFDETGGAAALHGDSSTDNLTTLTLGLRGATELAVGAHTARLTGGLGWRHAGGDVNPKTSLSFIQGSGASFSVAGAPIAKDAAVLDLGAEMAVGKQTAVGLSYSGQYGAGNADSAGTLYLKMRF